MSTAFTHNKAKYLTALLLLAVMAFGTSCSLFQKQAADLYGLWESTEANYHYLVYIDEAHTDMFMYEDESETMLLNTWSGTFTPPAGGFTTYAWTSVADADRSDSGYAHTLSDTASIDFEYKSDKLIIHTLVGTIELSKSDTANHPGCMKIIENNTRCLEAASSAQPLTYRNVLLFNTADGEYLCMAEMTNPNSFGVKPEFRFSDGNTFVWPTPAYIPAGETSVYVGILRYAAADYVSSPETGSCAIRYNIYSSEFDMTYPVVSVVDSEVVVDETTGLVSDIVVDLDVDQLPEPTVYGENVAYPDFSVYVVFYNEDKIVGAATGLANYESLDEPVSSWHISEVSAYDRYEVYVGSVLSKVTEE